MAIKKCFVEDEEVVVTTRSTTTTNGTVTEDEADDNSGAIRPQKVTEHVSLGKILKAVERNITAQSIDTTKNTNGIAAGNATWSGFAASGAGSRNLVIGNGHIRVSRPAIGPSDNRGDPLRSETKKFFVLNDTGQLVYLNSSLDEGVSSGDTALDSAWGRSPLTIQGPIGGITESTAGLFKTYSTHFWAFSDLFINTFSPASPRVIPMLSTSQLDMVWTAFIDGWTLPAAGDDAGTWMNRSSPLIDTTQTFTDHYTNITIPFSTRELELYVNNVHNPAYANIEAKYNFFSKPYESDPSAGFVIQDWRLPNLYSIMTKDNSLLQQQFADLDIGGKYVQNINTIHQEGTVGFQTSAMAMAPWEDLTDHFQFIGFPSSQISTLKRGSDHDDVHPMNNTLELKTEKTGDFLIAADLSGMTDNILKYVMSETRKLTSAVAWSQWSEKSPFAVSAEKVVVTHEQSDRTALVETTTSEFNTEINTEDLFLIDLEPWLNAHFDPSTTYQFSPTFDADSILLGIPAAQATTPNECNAFRDALQTIILSGKMQQIIDERFRTFEEMLEGKEAYNETVIYEIEKRSAYTWQGVSSPVMQRIFIPNTSELDILRYIDTQVKYDKEYTYDIYAHQLIVGTQYSYTSYIDMTQYQTGNRKMVQFGVNYGPSLKIARLPIYTQNTKILDAAPVWPNVSLIPYKGVSNKFLINLSSNVGDYDMQPIIINDQDATFAANFRMARQLFPDDPINFKSDDPVKRFEIYRMDTPPTAYTDFIGHLLTIAESTTATAVSYIDNILPNQKYYYMFRATDVHNNRSNPTDVYQVEIREFDGMIFFHTSIYTFEDPIESNNNVSTSRSFRRYLKINPNLVQSLVNETDSFGLTESDPPPTSAYNANQVILGKAGESVWASTANPKKFKIRVTSKNSGKKFDLNLTCKVQYNKTTQPT